MGFHGSIPFLVIDYHEMTKASGELVLGAFKLAPLYPLGQIARRGDQAPATADSAQSRL